MFQEAQQFIQSLSDQVKNLTTENSQLKSQVNDLTNLVMELKVRLDKMEGVEPEVQPTTVEEFWIAIERKHNIRKTQFTDGKITKFFKSTKQLQDLLDKGKKHKSYTDILGTREFQRGSPEDLATNKKSSPKK